MPYLGRTPDHADAQIRDSARVFTQNGVAMVRGQIRANWPMGHGYRDLDITADEAEALGLELIRTAVLSRQQVSAVNMEKATAKIEREALESNVAFYVAYGEPLMNVCRMLNESPQTIEATDAWKNREAVTT